MGEIAGIIDWQGVRYTAKGILDPSSEPSGDGTYWYGICMTNPNGIFFCVWQTDAIGTAPQLRWIGPKDMHRGNVKQEGDGRLIVTIYKGAGDAQPTIRQAIPGFVPRLPIAAAQPDPRVDNLQARIDSLETRLAAQDAIIQALHEELDLVNVGGIAPDDRSALDWIKKFMVVLKSISP